MAKFIATLCLLWLSVLVLVGFAARPVAARRHPLLIEDEGARRNRPAECQFGKTIRELHTTWFADLGPPFGVMYCIMCECVPFQKKRRVVGRVQCRNIKNECPKPTCDDPILLPGRCCKTCPGDAQSPDVVQDLPQATMPEEEERSKRKLCGPADRAHLLAAEEGRHGHDVLDAEPAERGRDRPVLVPQEEPLLQLLRVGAGGPAPLDPVRARERQHPGGAHARPAVGRGPAERVPERHRQGVRRVEARAARIPPAAARRARQRGAAVGQQTSGRAGNCRPDRQVSGPRARTVQLAVGTGSGDDVRHDGRGGRYRHRVHQQRCHLLHPPDDRAERAVRAGRRGRRAAERAARVARQAPAHPGGCAARPQAGPRHQRARGVVPGVRERSAAADARQADAHGRVPAPSRAAAAAGSGPWSGRLRSLPNAAQLARGGRAERRERARLDVPEPGRCARVPRADAPAAPPSRGGGQPRPHAARRQCEAPARARDAHARLHRRARVRPDRPHGPRVLEPLYAGELAIQVANEQNLTLLHGKFVTRQVADARDSAAPVLLRRGADAPAPLAHAVGLAWLAVDNECSLHYDLSLAGVPGAYHPLQLYLEELPLEAPNAPVARRLLEDFSGNQLEGFQLGLPPRELAKLETSVIYLEVRSNGTAEPVLRARLHTPTRVPPHCTGGLDNEVQQDPFAANDVPTVAANEKCFHSGRFYDEGETWRSAVEACTMCSCDHQQYKCEKMKCPPLRCRKEDIVQKKGECCPSCAAPKVAAAPAPPAAAPPPAPTSSNGRGCSLGDEFHEAGTTWHPYLHPSGYETCTICTCELFTLQVKCARAQCPPLPCSDKVAYRPDKKACCKVCPQVKEPKVSKRTHGARPDVQYDEAGGSAGTLRSPQAILAAGGCRYEENIYENGQEYHPILATHGEEKCIKCRCKDGQLNCSRKRCNRAMCNRQNAKQRALQQSQQQPADECCQCRPARHHRKRQQQQQQQQQQTSVKS
uniref:Uncharacterized protein n=1 Tax=Anopheles gambiae TaxID=7165 RepID=A0A1S4G9Q5_ANOGA